MFNAFEFWAGMWRSSAALTETSFKLADTLRASLSVVDKRSRTIADAVRSPLTADYAELGRMIPEKVEAFSQGTLAALSDMRALQSHMMANWQLMMTAGLAGRLPTTTEIGTMTGRTRQMIDNMASASGKALAPVHRTATANARRLSSKSK